MTDTAKTDKTEKTEKPDVKPAVKPDVRPDAKAATKPTAKRIVTAVHGRNKITAVYLDGELAATHDKHTKANGDFERHIQALVDQGYEVHEKPGDFQSYQDIPAELPAEK